MRLVLSFVALLVVLLAVLFSAKQQVQALKPPAGAASDGAASTSPSPQAIGQQVQDAIQQGAQRASDAEP